MNHALIQDSECRLKRPCYAAMKNLKHIILFSISGLLLLGLISSLALNAFLYWQIHGPFGWRDEVFVQTSTRATLEAMSKFRSGELRLYSIDPTDGDRHYTGTSEGPFEIWRPDFDPEIDNAPARRFGLETYVESYNRKMRYMLAHPEDFPLPEGIVPPDARSNSQETGSGDFVEFFLKQLAALGVEKTLTKEFDLPEATWKSESDSLGFTIEMQGWNFQQTTSFLRALFGKPFANSTLSDGSSSAMVRGDKFLIQFSETDDGGIRFMGTK